jgi:isopropylmalate/homocitrate/citramalate synthase
VLSIDDRLALIERLVEAGARRIEVVSFAHPDRVPQMAGAEEICAALAADRTWSAIGLVLNRRGLERAMTTALDELNFVAYASDGYSQRNTGKPAAQRNAEVAEMVSEARSAGRKTSVTISVAFGDPVEGDIPAERPAEVAGVVADAGAHEVTLGDTIGTAVPSMVEDRVKRVNAVAPGLPVRCHFHNTRATGSANVIAAVAAGVEGIDASVGGYGGSPLSPGAGGNVATEDVVWMLERMGRPTGMDLDVLIDTARWLAGRLGSSEPPGMLSRAGRFP